MKISNDLIVYILVPVMTYSCNTDVKQSINQSIIPMYKYSETI